MACVESGVWGGGGGVGAGGWMSGDAGVRKLLVLVVCQTTAELNDIFAMCKKETNIYR